jgi:hypothetical protein
LCSTAFIHPMNHPLLTLDIRRERTQLQLAKVVSSITLQFFPVEYTISKRDTHRIRCYYIELLKRLSSRITVHTTLFALLYMKRLIEHSNTRINPESVLSVLTVAFIFADLTSNDEAISMSDWSDITRTSGTELARMKREFLNGIEFHLMISEEQYAQWIMTVSFSLNSSPISPISPTVKAPQSIVDSIFSFQVA